MAEAGNRLTNNILACERRPSGGLIQSSCSVSTTSVSGSAMTIENGAAVISTDKFTNASTSKRPARRAARNSRGLRNRLVNCRFAFNICTASSDRSRDEWGSRAVVALPFEK